MRRWPTLGLRRRSDERARPSAAHAAETDAVDGRLDTWPQRYDARATQDAAGDVALQDPIDTRLAKVARTRGGLQVGYEVMAPLSGEYAHHPIFFDVDRLDHTGWRSGVYPSAFGAEYMLEDIVLYRHEGKGGLWAWERVEQASYGTSDVGVELWLGVSALQAGLIGSKLVLRGKNPSRDDFAFHGAR